MGNGFFNRPIIARTQSEGQEKGFWRWFPDGLPQAPVVQKVDSAIHWINFYPADSAIGFPNTYNPTFEQPGPEV